MSKMSKMFQEELKEYVHCNPQLVKMKPCGENMYILKYTKKVFYKGLWNKYLEHCRGTIVDEDFNIIAYPFTKIYNYGIETDCPVFDENELIEACRKVNGFMATITWHNNDLLISTTGSVDSDHTQYIRDMIDIEKYSYFCKSNPRLSLMFECVHPQDPHIIQEEFGMHLIGYRKKTWHSNILNASSIEIARCLDCFHEDCRLMLLSELVTLAKTVEHEGFVFYNSDGVSAKIKSPHYLAKKYVTRNPNTSKLLTQQAKEIVDEEYYPLIDNIRYNIDHFTSLSEQQRLLWVTNFLRNDNATYS